MKDSQLNSQSPQGHPISTPSPALRLFEAFANFDQLDEDSPAIVTLTVEVKDESGPGLLSVVELGVALTNRLTGALVEATVLHQTGRVR